MRFSLEGKLALICAGLVLFAVMATAALAHWTGAPAIAALIVLLVLSPLVVSVARSFMRPIIRILQAVGDGIASIKDRDFSVSIAHAPHDELRSLVQSYNGLGEVLRTERQGLYQRELLLDTVIQATPLAMVLTNAADRIVYSNVAARQAFLGGRKLEGLSFTGLLAAGPEPLRVAVAGEADALFTMQSESGPEIYHLSQRSFLLNAQSHRLFLLKQMTRELSRQEVDTWKKVIRVIAHELNNSLAPISSLAHSGRQSMEQPQGGQLERIFRTIEDRARHLHSFIDGYARFAKLPRPQPEAVNWAAFLRSLQETVAFTLGGDLPMDTGVFDPAQMEQVLINLVKNAREAGSQQDAVQLCVDKHAGGWRIQVLDRGSGMPDESLRSALLPFYSTKPSGAGLGLTVCREVIEAHDGRISLANRAGGGLAVTLWIPIFTFDLSHSSI